MGWKGDTCNQILWEKYRLRLKIVCSNVKCARCFVRVYFFPIKMYPTSFLGCYTNWTLTKQSTFYSKRQEWVMFPNQCEFFVTLRLSHKYVLHSGATRYLLYCRLSFCVNRPITIIGMFKERWKINGYCLDNNCLRYN